MANEPVILNVYDMVSAKQFGLWEQRDGEGACARRQALHEEEPSTDPQGWGCPPSSSSLLI